MCQVLVVYKLSIKPTAKEPYIGTFSKPEIYFGIGGTEHSKSHIRNRFYHSFPESAIGKCELYA